MSYIDNISSRIPGFRCESSVAAWIPVMRGIDDVEDGEIDVLGSAFSTASAPSLGLGHDPRSGLRVEHPAQAGAHDRVIVGDQDSRDERDRHQLASTPVRLRAGTSKRTSTPPLAAGFIASAPPTSSARSRIPRRPPALGGRPSPNPRPLSTRSAPRCPRPLRATAHTARVRVAGDVRQALLRDAVDRQLRVLGQRRQRLVEVAVDPDPGAAAQTRRAPSAR